MVNMMLTKWKCVYSTTLLKLQFLDNFEKFSYGIKKEERGAEGRGGGERGEGGEGEIVLCSFYK